MKRTKILASLFATLFVAIGITQSASCTLGENGAKPPDTTLPCVTAADCEDNNPCTTEVCNDQSICVFTNEADGPLASSMQTAGDCLRTDCKAGAALVIQDPEDVRNDNEPCTADTCQDGMVLNSPLPDNGVCQQGSQSGTCQKGVCKISCDAQNPCNDSNPCTTDTCDSGTSTCVFTGIDGSPTPGAMQPAGDCKVQLCILGKDTAVDDDADVPVDGNSCTEDVCTAGVPSNPGTTSGTYCVSGKPEVCDGAGKCVECVAPENCVGIVETDCIKRDCDLATNTCKQKYLGNETTAFAQTTGDCQKNVCNGTDGGTVSIADDTDKPNDNNACTTDSCSGGVKTFVNVSQGTNCGGTKVCNAGGQCVGCNLPTDCQGVDDDCKARTCISNICGTSYTPNNTPLPAADQTSMDCKVVVCDGAGNTKIIADQTDVPPDDGKQCTKNQCSAQGAPIYPSEPVNTMCSQTGGDVCDGNGACKKSNGKNCAASGECLNANCVDTVCCNTSCNATCRACNIAGSVGTCSNVPKNTDDSPTCINASTCDGNANCKKEDGQGCSGNADCVNGFCVDGTCCESACTGQCKACNVAGSPGKCSNTPSGQTDTNSSPTCSGTNVCDGNGGCKKANGQTCSVNGDCLNGACVDGYCCDSTCTASCKACNVMGSLGVCSNIPINQPDNNASMTCSGTSSCDGVGNCKANQGQPCATNAICVNNTCVDGYCCDSACSGTCKACDIPASLGVCTNVPAGQDDAPMCSSMTSSCDGAGNCKKDNGQSCTVSGDCLTGNCVDTVCCDTSCSGTCKSCNIAGSVGTCTNVASGATDNTCMAAGQQCDGAGGCKKVNGQVCSVDGDCLNGQCVDSICCNNSCNGTCDACNVAGSVGTCTPIPQYSPDNNATTTCTGNNVCDGMSNCKLANGQDCAMGGSPSCASGNCVNDMGTKTCQML